MKLSRLFVLGTFGLMSLSAGAVINDRTAPEAPATGAIDVSTIDKTPVDFVVGNAYVMYNTGTNMYYYRGNAWGTQASGNADQALLVRFVESSDPGSLWLRDWDDRSGQEKWRTAFITTTDSKACTTLGLQAALFVDNNDGGAALMKVTDMGSKVYRISVSDKNSATTGANISTENTYFAVTDLSYDGDGMGGNAINPIATEGNIDWQFFAVTEWNDYFSDLKVYEKAEELKALILKAEEAHIDVSDAEAVYNNLSSTIEDIEAAIKALGQAMASGITGSSSNPGDATSLIINPNFDDASDEGWKGIAPNMVGSGSHGPANVAEQYDKTFDTYQDLVGLPTGVYGLSASNAFRGSWEDYEAGLDAAALLYATVGGNTFASPFDNMWSVLNGMPMAGETEFGTNASENSQTIDKTTYKATYYIPNDPSAARLYFEKGFYHNAIVFSATDYEARIGVKNPAKNGTGDNWSLFDTFSLKYYGNEGTPSYKAWLNDNAKLLYSNELPVTKVYVTQFEAIYTSANPADAAEANAAYETARKSDELKTLRENISLWLQWNKALNDAQQYTQGEYASLNAAKTLGSYYTKAKLQQMNPTWTNTQIESEIADIAKMVQDVIDEKMNNIGVGEDVTALYIGKEDAEFANGKGGWTVEGDGCNFNAGCAEAYNQEFDLYKEIASVNAAGVYELQLQGFFRLMRDQTAFDMYGRGEQDKTKAWIYMNDVKSYVGCVFDEPVPSGVFENGDNATSGEYWVDNNTDNWYANTMTSAAECFNHDMYKVKAYGLVANAGDELRIGVAGNMKGSNWMIWDKFKLTFVGYDAATIKPILEEALANMPDLSEPMGKSVYNRATAAVAAAESAGKSNDGKKMFDALKELWDVEGEIEKSIIKFKQLTTAMEGLEELFAFAENPEAIEEAGPFKEQLEADLEDHKYEDEDVDGLLQQIKEFRYKLRIPAEIKDGDDLTNVLETPSFVDGEGNNSVEGWNAEGYNFGNDDEQKSALALEFYNKAFDINQTIYGLPNGKYTVKVNAFQRTVNPAYLYVASGGEETKKDLVELEDGAITAKLADEGLDVPNSMVSASAAFDTGFYLNEIVATVTDGTLTVGIKKEKNTKINEETGEETEGTVDWIVMDNWTLICGVHLSGLPGDVNGDNVVDVADISAIISVMAGSEVNKDTADVNGDGEVDVADISATITIMANNARAAKAIEE